MGSLLALGNFILSARKLDCGLILGQQSNNQKGGARGSIEAGRMARKCVARSRGLLRVSSAKLLKKEIQVERCLRIPIETLASRLHRQKHVWEKKRGIVGENKNPSEGGRGLANEGK